MVVVVAALPGRPTNNLQQREDNCPLLLVTLITLFCSKDVVILYDTDSITGALATN